MLKAVKLFVEKIWERSIYLCWNELNNVMGRVFCFKNTMYKFFENNRAPDSFNNATNYKIFKIIKYLNRWICIEEKRLLVWPYPLQSKTFTT